MMGSRLEVHEKPEAVSGTGAPDRSRIRVLLIASSLDAIGGQSIQADTICRGFRDDHSVQVHFQPINPRLPAPFHSLQQIKFLRTLLTFVLYCFKLVGAIRRSDVVHAFSASYLSFVLAPTPAIYLARWFGRPLILNYHSGEAEDHLKRWPSAHRLLRRVDQIVVPSRFLVDVFSRFGLDAREVHNAVDLSAYEFRARSTFSPRFLVNRSFEKHYNVSCVLQAFARIQKAIPAATLTVAGDGPLRDELRSLAETLGLRDVRFVGRVRPEAMPGLYAVHDIWLNASDIDNMPLSILEAFSSGLLVISTNAGGIPYLVRHLQTGLLVECGNAEALANAAIKAVTEPEQHVMLTRRAREECNRYTWETIHELWRAQYVELYEKRKTTVT